MVGKEVAAEGKTSVRMGVTKIGGSARKKFPKFIKYLRGKADEKHAGRGRESISKKTLIGKLRKGITMKDGEKTTRH